jgi:hypothetical protein
MKHTSSISRKSPIPADETQDIICFIFTELGAYMDAKGATVPIITYMADKCVVEPIN